jgi:hypothetical protein
LDELITSRARFGDLSEARFSVFDMDGDSAPELCIRLNAHYIFKYVPETDMIVLWYESGQLWYELLGTSRVCYTGGGSDHVYYKLNSNGDEYCRYFFFSREHFNESLSRAEVVYMVSLPEYTDKDNAPNVSMSVKMQGYLTSHTDRYYFRVTKEQYEELIEEYRQSNNTLEERLKDVSITYEELVG